MAGAPFNTTAVVTESYAYQGVEGRISQKTTRNTVNGIDYELFTQSWTYDRAGAVLTMTYPTCSNGGCGAGPLPSAARVVSFGYTNGFLTDIPGFTGVHSAPSPPVGLLYHSNGLLASAMHANGVRDSVTVDATNWLRRPKRLETVDVLSNRNFVAGDYTYDASGNIKAIGADLFKYDKVSRLTEGTVRVPSWVTPAQPARTQGYSFDDFGNITAVTGTNARNTPTSDLTNRLTGTGTSYDEAGNLTSHNGTNYQYDRLNVLKRMTTAAGAAQEDWIYVYAADDERLWSYRVGGGGSLWSLRDLAGQVIRQFEAHTSWSTTRDYVRRDGQLFATILPSGAVQHDHLDHLGTPRLITDANKAAVANFTYFPFGEEVAAGTVSAERMRFTGHERDLNNAGGAGDDLDYMHARFCSPVTGRFLSVDPGRPDQSSPQSWNRYAYSRGNPMKFVDLDGRDITLIAREPNGFGDFGHVAVRVHGPAYDLTFDFGAYNGTEGSLGVSGEGVLKVWWDYEAFIAAQRENGDVVAITYETSVQEDVEIMQGLANLIDAPKGREGDSMIYGTTEDYSVTEGNTCVTICIGALLLANEDSLASADAETTFRGMWTPGQVYDGIQGLRDRGPLSHSRRGVRIVYWRYNKPKK